MVLDLGTWLTIAISAGLPMLVAVITAQHAHPGVKAVVLLLLSALSALLGEWLDAVTSGTPFNWPATGGAALAAFLVAVATHFGLLKPVGITGKEGLIQTVFPKGLVVTPE